ncbi:glycosyltransferase [Adhaeribacter rhizoryzae]|uniref:Glycosyltransferase family 2 protein n=1 Tax=Adhaeribacter rhizoryzae TaxID=2607907 RepID=A0A5M6DLA5_9BACT|nr:glycosyltransferase [Adhaeribacter rhizoryzae]KAA5548321.1 glycosyltransferase family 2 protein [Adhaeribacter rhizoryzae]
MPEVKPVPPLVSIIMPAFNCELFVSKAIESVLIQTYSQWELLVADDKSDDATKEIVNKYAGQDVRIKVFHNSYNQGIVRTRNKLLENTQGSLIAFLDADDWIAPTKLEKQVNILIASKVEAVGTNYFAAYLNGEIIKNSKGVSKQIISKEDIYQLPFWLPSIMITKNLLQKVGGYHSYFNDMACYEDLYWIYEILELSKIQFIEEPLYYYRHNPNSVTKTLNYKRLAGQRLVNELITQRLTTGQDWLSQANYKEADNYINALINDKAWQAECYRRVAAIKIDEKNYKNAVELLTQSLKLNLKSLKSYRTLFYLFKSIIRNS